MKRISANELLRQLVEVVEAIALSGPEQVAWLDAHGIDMDELGLQLGDAVPLWFERLGSEGLLDDGAKVAPMNLFDAMAAIGGRENQLLWRSEGLLTSEKSNGVREQARTALGCIERT